MLDVIKRYSEEQYYRKEDFNEEFDASIAHVLWEETQRYRMCFRYDCKIMKQNMYVVLCRKVMFALLHCEQVLQRYCVQCEDFTLDETWESIEVMYHMFGTYEQNEWIHMACATLAISDVAFCEYIITSDEPLILRIFMCIKHKTSDDVLQLLLLCENKVAIMRIINTYNRTNRNMGVDDEDMTYDFLKFIEQMELKILQGMVSLKQTCDTIDGKMDIKELSQRYPILSMAQLAFYKKHRTSNHYYTIQEYVEFANVCYETARGAMDLFVSMHWYQKRKLGKKYVYYIYET